MPDTTLLDKLSDRDESALEELAGAYGSYCKSVALQILGSAEDAEECVSDALHKVWQTVPPARPESLKFYFAKITRNLALNRRKAQYATRRGSGEGCLSVHELDECLPAPETVEGELERKLLATAISDFLSNLSPDARILFVRRYWYLEGVGELARRFGVSESKVASSLSRTRKKLRRYLLAGGYQI